MSTGVNKNNGRGWHRLEHIHNNLINLGVTLHIFGMARIFRRTPFIKFISEVI
jgi:hypothetical protein